MFFPCCILIQEISQIIGNGKLSVLNLIKMAKKQSTNGRDWKSLRFCSKTYRFACFFQVE